MKKFYAWFMYDAGDVFKHISGVVTATSETNAVEVLASLTGHTDDVDGSENGAISQEDLGNTTPANEPIMS